MTQIMSYDRDLSRLPTVSRDYSFAGDEYIADEDYKSALYNTYLPKFSAAVAFMKRYGIPFTEPDKERVKRVLTATGWLDHFVDESPDRPAALKAFNLLIAAIETKDYPKLPVWARPELLISVSLLANAVHELPLKDRQKLIATALRLGEYSVEKRNARTVRDYASIVIAEGGLSGDLAIEVLSPGAKAHKNYGRLFRFNHRAIGCANILDAALDLKQDFRDGLVTIRPTFLNKLYLFARFLAYLPVIIAELGYKGVIVALKVGLN